ncbi:lipopolysaccharide kinase InaA family protein [Pseudomonas sp. TE3610]
MQSLNHSSYLALREGAKVLEADGSGDKVLLLADGRFLKLFRRKRLFTSAALFPYAQRFASNTQRLLERGIPCPHVLNVYRIPSIERDGVYYEPLAGDTLRQLMADPAKAQALRTQFGAFVARLHDQGVYFRSLHLGNVVLTPHGTLGLIDIADLRCYRRSLSASKRLRNFQHMLRYKADLQWLRGEDGAQTFLDGYHQALPASLAESGLMSRLGAALA